MNRSIQDLSYPETNYFNCRSTGTHGLLGVVSALCVSQTNRKTKKPIALREFGLTVVGGGIRGRWHWTP